MKTDIEISNEANMEQILAVGARIGANLDDLIPYGHYKAKLSKEFIAKNSTNKTGKLVLVTAIHPTPAGEGKTTVSIGLGDALCRIGKRNITCLREPSLGPCFGIKGGAAGGGYAQVVPMEDINLHFTGDFHAIGAANNLLAAAIDNHIHWGNELGIDARRITWHRAIDMNDRALRTITCSLGGVTNGYPREEHFDITVASEIMAVFCLASDLEDLKKRLGNMVVAYTQNKSPIHARDLKVDGALLALLKDAFQPNLVQTLENNPVFIHGGPFANIAHGCNSVVATKAALSLADYVVTEAGFGADLGAEKFFNIKMRKSGLSPSCAVIVATIRALKMHGGAKKNELDQENLEQLKKGFANLGKHIENIKSFGVPLVVAINKFATDTDTEIEAVIEYCRHQGADAYLCEHHAKGSEGTVALAEAVSRICDGDAANFSPTYTDQLTLKEKIKTIARKIYGAEEVNFELKADKKLDELQTNGYGEFPVCMAKTQSSFSSDPKLLGAPRDHTLTVKDVRLSAGAEFVVILCGNIMTMPGLPRVPAAQGIDVDSKGSITGLF